MPPPVARRLSRAPSTVSRELKRNMRPHDQAPAALNALAAHDTVLQTVPSGKAATISVDAEPIDRPMSLWLRAGQPGDT
ncbi:helix-turn-helix domain-containing protein [Spirillospora sp. NPDC127506]